ncbi:MULTISPECIES: ExbD/TolR family protein [Desulfatibacillum]|jgi:biopolymer transport protein ExbD|uniref:Biopolymer transport protein ExbD/TolR n=2 Tax=Desulfatibacillum TaxID=218207 RepID=B8FC10_DESAL|nr:MULTISPECIES: biopolymer transporter ExbD [Desulfatibacillum]ACL05215.1 Biopolymer transport protein ExbD/TolR [Desulfatibacillum aliphaticivorans]SHJ50942.1 outer membrane transport energization protein ExbD [Desulfatibacillum alkenivorans DSM 16219]
MIGISNARRAARKDLEINMSPLIDMVFILLIFFLVTTSFVRETGIDVHRPTASTAVSKEKATILVGVTKDNRIFMEKREIDVRAVRLHVERALAENPEGSVVVVADRDSSTGTVISVMDDARLAGAKNVSLAASLDGEGA